MANELQKKNRILLFEDDLEVRDICVVILNEIGYNPVTGSIWEDVLFQVANYRPDLILMDSWPLGKYWVEPIRKLKSSNLSRNIPLIYYSTNLTYESLALKEGANNYLSKPFDISELENLVDTLIC